MWRSARRMFSGVIGTILFTHLVFAATTPSPLSIPPDQYWDGNDGKWSTFGMQIGTPGQPLRLLPATGQQSIWVVLPEGCVEDDPPTCGDDRGTLFLTNRTSSWDQRGLFQLSIIEEKLLGLNGSGLYGFDTATLGWPGDNLPSLTHQVIAGIATKDFYMGTLPLSPWPVNFTSLTDSSPSLLSSLKNQSKIPSVSWGYTAGMYNHNPPVFGSLTLGGYDASRRQANTLNFSMGSDMSRDLLVAVQGVTVSSSSSSNLLSNPIYAFINSLVSHLWLPLDACKAFEKAFNLTWDDQTQLYLIDDTQHQKLLQQNPTVTFKIGPGTSGEAVNIDMPYGSFDLAFPSNTTRYFPLKRAASADQYTLGRAFLQNAYVAANYEYFNFSVSQATYPSTSVPKQLVALSAKGTPKASSSGLSTGAIVGIAVGGVVVAILAIGLAYFFCFRKKNKQESRPNYTPVGGAETYAKAELDTTQAQLAEAEGRPIGHEMDATNKPPKRPWQNNPVELAANEVAASEVHTPDSTPYGTPFITPNPTPGPRPNASPPPAVPQSLDHQQQTWITQKSVPRQSSGERVERWR